MHRCDHVESFAILQSRNQPPTMTWLHTLLFCALVSFSHGLLEDNPIEGTTPKAVLDYGTFQGAYDETYNISYFKSIPFAAPPVGDLRFRAPQPPLKYEGVFDSSVTKDFCVQRTVNGSEDCLYLEVYGRQFEASAKKPVLVWLYGGGYIQGGGSTSWPPFVYPTLNVSTLNDFIVVLPNYRVNSFGFLAGELIKEDPTTDLNVGLLDQQAAMKWVQKYIHVFGGDASKVTLWGQSAGAGSVLSHVIASSSKELFEKAVASSPFIQKQYAYNSPEVEEVFTAYVSGTGCGSVPRYQVISCLRKVDLQTIRDVSLEVDVIHKNVISHAWTPVIDGDLLKERFSVATARGNVNPGYALSVYNTHEGENFVPNALMTTQTYNEWVEAYLPNFSEDQFRSLNELYPAYEADSVNGSYKRAADVYRDSVLACPALWATTATAKTGKKGYFAEFSVSPAKHASDTQYWNTIQPAQELYPHIYQAYSGGYASFVQTGNPNKNSLTKVQYPEVVTGRLFLIGDGGVANSTTPVRTERYDQLKRKCDFWRENAADVPL